MTIHPRLSAATIAAAVLCAAAATAQIISPPSTSQPPANAAHPALDLSALRTSDTPADGSSLSPMPRTAVDHTFAAGGLSGSAGFLCGLRSAPDNNGAASALGYDPQGRFVGARLSVAFP